jgi:hypothetical protein
LVIWRISQVTKEWQSRTSCHLLNQGFRAVKDFVDVPRHSLKRGGSN